MMPSYNIPHNKGDSEKGFGSCVMKQPEQNIPHINAIKTKHFNNKVRRLNYLCKFILDINVDEALHPRQHETHIHQVISDMNPIYAS